MKYRIAKQIDCKYIVELHYAIRETYSVGIFAQLGKPFLKQYYRIILNDRNSVIVCAEDDHGVLQGFCSATLDVEAQMSNIRSHKVSLALSAMTSIIRKPSLIKHLIDRYKIIKNESTTKIISTKGARSEYWVWRASNQDSVSSVEMYFLSLNILKSLGVKELFGEVDTVNKKILKFQQANGSEIIDKITLPDGRERVIIKTDLVNWEPKI
jgi:hypothetical protein